MISDLLGNEDIETVHTPKVHFATRVLVVGTVQELTALQTITRVVVSKGICTWIELGQSVAGAQPEITLRILKDSLDDIARESPFIRVPLKGPILAIQPVEATATRSHPEPTRLVLVYASDVVVAQTLGILGIVLVQREGFGLTVKLEESTL